MRAASYSRGAVRTFLQASTFVCVAPAGSRQGRDSQRSGHNFRHRPLQIHTLRAKPEQGEVMASPVHQTLRVAVLNNPGRDDYVPMFERFLKAASKDTTLDVQVDRFTVWEGQLPAADSAYDAFIISGSRCGVYEECAHPWITGLLDWIVDAHKRDRRILGICFGHQAVAKALGGSVIANPDGFEIGNIEFPVSEGAREYFRDLGAPFEKGSLSMLYVHGDYAEPGKAPEGFSSMGGTAVSPINGLYNGRNILTFQGHPEFLPEEVDALIPVLSERGHLPGRLPQGETLDTVRESLRRPTDADWLQRVILAFLSRKGAAAP